MWAFVVVGAATLASWLLTAPMARVGLRVGLVDLPSSRRTRARPIPTTGGIVIFLTLAASLALSLRFYGYASPEIATKLTALLLGGTAIVILGMVDDRVNLRPRVKLVVQLAVAIAVVSSGVAVDRIRFFFGPAFELGQLGGPLSVLWLVGCMNAVNLVDGLDGLASGIVSIGAVGLFAVGVINENPLLYMMAAGLLGSSLGFLVHNFRYGNVYLGDAGSMVLGFFLAGGAIVGAYADAASNAVLVAGACMAVPIFDVATTIMRRERAHRGVMTPDSSHTHHRLIRFGLSPRMAVIVLWGVTIFFGGQVLGLIATHGIIYMLGSYAVALVVGRIVLRQHRKNKRTIKSDLMDELQFLLGSRGTGEDQVGMTLREIMVAQIRREALYRRLTREDAAARAALRLPADPPSADAAPGGEPATARRRAPHDA
ncbi:MAG: MraY family glycosyltransferase [Candidatus Eisenbacteria bacterium]